MIRILDTESLDVNGKSKKALNILVIDDEQSFLALMHEVLTLEGYSVTTSSSGQEGIDAYKAQRPDLVFLDLIMPGMNGLQVLKALRQFDDAARIIVITGYGSIELAVTAMQEGAVDFIEKISYTKNIREAMSEKIKAVLDELEGGAGE